MFDTLKEWDRELFIFLNNLGAEPYDFFWIFVTKIESWIFLFILATFLIFKFYRGKQGALVFGMVLLTFGITFLITYLTKEWVGRIRPNNDPAINSLIRVLQQAKGYSFFSGHASSSVSITMFLIFILRKHSRWIYLALLWPVLFITSRIYVGVHYPSDVLIGTIVGLVFAILGYRVCRKWLTNP